MSVNIKSKRRTRDIVDAKMIYSKLLREKGFTLKKIGETLGKDHTTIIHYIRAMDNLIETEPNMNNTYAKCRDIFFEGEEREAQIDPEILKIRMKDLRRQCNILNIELQKQKEQNRRYKRLSELVSVLDQRIPKGKEEQFKTIINRVFNNIEYYVKE